MITIDFTTDEIKQLLKSLRKDKSAYQGLYSADMAKATLVSKLEKKIGFIPFNTGAR